MCSLCLFTHYYICLASYILYPVSRVVLSVFLELLVSRAVLIALDNVSHMVCAGNQKNSHDLEISISLQILSSENIHIYMHSADIFIQSNLNFCQV